MSTALLAVVHPNSDKRRLGHKMLPLFLALFCILSSRLYSQTLTVYNCQEPGFSCAPNDPQIGGYPISYGAVTQIQPLTFGNFLPQMPNLDVTDTQLGCSDYANVMLTTSYIGPQNAYFPNAYTSYANWDGYIPSGGDWLIDWTNDLEPTNSYSIEGGSAQFYVSVDGGPYLPDMSFSNQGVAPSKSTILSFAAQAGEPWFFTGIMQTESGYIQFYNQHNASGITLGPGTGGHPCAPNNPATNINVYDEGGPKFGCPDGYGIVQIDGASGALWDADLWDWTANVSEGIAHALSDQSAGYASYGLQVAKMMSDQNSINGACKGAVTSGCVLPSPLYGAGWGTCNFSYGGAGQNNLEDASWIKAYNSGGSGTIYYWHTGVNGGNGYWTLTQHPGYVQAVCQGLQ